MLGKDAQKIQAFEEIPYLPVEAFKHHSVVSGKVSSHAQIFESSRTTGSIPSRHIVTHPESYRQSLLSTFHLFYGNPAEWCILALLPSYLEQGNSSLVYMCQVLMDAGAHPQSGFYLHNGLEALQRATALRDAGHKVLLLGVTYALLDLGEKHPTNLRGITLMETGGMKGRRREMIREEVHAQLMQAFGVGEVHSEYGMTELLSQAYSRGKGLFQTPPWMRIVLRDSGDPLSAASGNSGAINVCDLSNLHSCAFIATQDLGRQHPDGLFEVLGRFDNAEVRGCNLLVAG